MWHAHRMPEQQHCRDPIPNRYLDTNRSPCGAWYRVGVVTLFPQAFQGTTQVANVCNKSHVHTCNCCVSADNSAAFPWKSSAVHFPRCTYAGIENAHQTPQQQQHHSHHPTALRCLDSGQLWMVATMQHGCNPGWNASMRPASYSVSAPIRRCAPSR